MKVQKYQRGKQVAYFAPYAQVVNTHAETLETVHDILSRMNVGHHISWPQPRQHPSGRMPCDEYKPLWQVKIHGLHRCKTLLEQLAPWLVTKREQARLVLEFIASREASYYKHLPYSQRELAIANHFRLRRHSGRPTEALPLESLNDYTQGMPA